MGTPILSFVSESTCANVCKVGRNFERQSFVFVFHAALTTFWTIRLCFNFKIDSGLVGRVSAGRLARLAGGRAGSGTEAEADAEGVAPAAAGRLVRVGGGAGIGSAAEAESRARGRKRAPMAETEAGTEEAGALAGPGASR